MTPAAAPAVEQTNPNPFKLVYPVKPIRYSKDENGNPRIAPGWGKPKGRRHPHLSLRAQAIKSKAMGIFRTLFTNHSEKLYAEAQAAKQDFNGVPVADISQLGARAATLAMRTLKKENRAAKKRTRKRQQLSRRINSGIQPGNTNVHRFGA